MVWAWFCRQWEATGSLEAGECGDEICVLEPCGCSLEGLERGEMRQAAWLGSLCKGLSEAWWRQIWWQWPWGWRQGDLFSNVDTRELGGIGLLRMEKKGDLRMTPKSLVFVSGWLVKHTSHDFSQVWTSWNSGVSHHLSEFFFQFLTPLPL